MIQTLLRHKLILVAIAILIAGIAWYAMTPTAETPNVVGTTSTTQGVAPADQSIVATLLTLRAVKLDGTIFNDPAFLSLKDFSTEIVPEPVGRPNPFAPLPSQSKASASSTKAANIFTPGGR